MFRVLRTTLVTKDLACSEWGPGWHFGRWLATDQMTDGGGLQKVMMEKISTEQYRAHAATRAKTHSIPYMILCVVYRRAHLIGHPLT